MMATPSPPKAARLKLRYRDKPDDITTFPIYTNHQFELGRVTVENALEVTMPCISTHHLCFRCVGYEEPGELRVAPMVYLRVLSKNNVLLTRCDDKSKHVITGNGPDVLLNHGDVLHLTTSLSIEFLLAKHFTTIEDGLNRTQKHEFAYFEDLYHVTNRRLGAGAQANVFVAINKKTQQQVACKIVKTPLLAEIYQDRVREDRECRTEAERQARIVNLEQYVIKKRADMKREYDILQRLDHPNIISLQKVFHSPNNLYIFQELLTGGDLMSYIEQKGIMSEPQAAVIVRQLLKAVEYLHDNGVVHRDIKPENILLTSWRDGARIVLTDFGQSRTIRNVQVTSNSSAAVRMQTLVGTVGYAAPEVLRLRSRKSAAEGYGASIDIWAIGCITACLLTGEKLIKDAEEEEEEERKDDESVRLALEQLAIDLAAIDNDPGWQLIGRKATDFVRRCVAVQESQRLTATQALAHMWLSDPRYVAELEAVYHRSVQDWKPREADDQIIQIIDAAIGDPLLATDTKSRHFPGTRAVPLTPSLFFRDQTHAGLLHSTLSSGAEIKSLDMTGLDLPGDSLVTQASTIVPDFTEYTYKRAEGC